MSERTGSVALARFVVRRDRVRMLVWIAGILLLVVSTAASVKGLYPTQADLDEAAALSQDNAAAIAFNGPAQGLDTIGGQVAFQVGSIGLVVVALMSLLMIGRLTRGEEESGRTELVRSMPVGAHAPMAAALVAVAAMNVAVGALVALSLIGQDLPVTGSIVFGASFVALGFVFAAIAAVLAQVTENTRVVYGAAGAVLGASFVLRAIGDIGDGTVSWFSPIGWAQKARPYAGERWWPLLLLLVLAAGLVTVAVALAERRDLGGGLVAPRRGRRVANPALGHPIGLALRLQRGSLIGWGVGVFLGGVAYGSIGDSIDDLVGDNKAIADVIARAGGATLTDSYLTTALMMLALIATGYAVQSALRLRSEETAMRAEPVLATHVSRDEWVASHLVVAFGGSAVVLAAAGLGTGGTYAIVTGDAGAVPRLLGASLLYTPAVWSVVGLAAALFGLVPRAVLAAWAVVAACFVTGLLGELLDLPQWVSDLSPFERTPQLPAGSLALLPLVGLIAIAGTLTGAGVAGFRHRDVG